MTLRATIEIVPYGDESRKREIYRVDISNIGKSAGNPDPNICDYRYRLLENESERVTGTIREHSRSDGALALVQEVLEDIGWTVQPAKGE